MTPEAILPWVAELMANDWDRKRLSYARDRRRWARTVRLPAHKGAEPDPATLGVADDEEG